VRICRFTSLDEVLPKSAYGNRVKVLQALARVGRFSVFEVTDSPTLARTMDRLGRDKLYRRTGGVFPWTEIELTATGRALCSSVG
jgi:hypothetical protein